MRFYKTKLSKENLYYISDTHQLIYPNIYVYKKGSKKYLNKIKRNMGKSSDEYQKYALLPFVNHSSLPSLRHHK